MVGVVGGVNMGWFDKSLKVSALEHEIVILKMQVAGLQKELADCDAFVTVLNAENEYLKADGAAPESLPTWDGPDSP